MRPDIIFFRYSHNAVSAFFLIVLLIVAINLPINAQETIRLWEGKAPGSENWDYQEKTSSFPGGGDSCPECC